MQSGLIDANPTTHQEKQSVDQPSNDCAQLLESYGLNYAETKHYLHVGDSSAQVSWIFYISIIRLQLTPALNKIIPLLLDQSLSFKIPKDKTTARKMLDGSFGLDHIGKIICIYPSIEQIQNTAKTLIDATTGFRGPAVPGTHYLGACVYTEHAEKHAHPQMNRSKKSGKAPSWPFNEVIPLQTPVSKPLWNYKYRPLQIIKPDFKGNVIRANYFKSPFNIRSCVIKEGIKNMWADEFGRDIVDRIKWQYELYQELAGYVPTPNIFDCFYEGGNIYLTMEYIKGLSFNDILTYVYDGGSWMQLPLPEKIKLTDYFIKILQVVDKLHTRNFVHRDITPANFIVDKNHNIHLIDMELTYSLKKQHPLPPFKQGTAGYMSIEQKRHLPPTIKEDIYALGALMIRTFCGISPMTLDTGHLNTLQTPLNSLTDNFELTALIVQCLSPDPEARPTITNIITFFHNYLAALQLSAPNDAHTKIRSQSSHSEMYDLTEVIQTGINGLQSHYCLSEAGFWLNLPLEPELPGIAPSLQQPHPSFFTGVAGILFVLARSYQQGFDLNFENYNKHVQYLEQQDTHETWDFAFGKPGMAVAIAEGIRSELIDIGHLSNLDNYFHNIELSNLALSTGIAGHGLALLSCKPFITESLYETQMNQIISRYLKTQLKNGSWPIFRDRPKIKGDTITGMLSGTAGIIYFLLQYARANKNDTVLRAIARGMEWLKINSIRRDNGYVWPVSVNSKSIDISFAHGSPGIIMTFIQAFDVLQDPDYKKVADKALYLIPEQRVSDDFTQYSGLAALGELSLDAYVVLNSEQWRARATWIAALLANTQICNPRKQGHWWINMNNELVRGLINGSAGILHFLLRAKDPFKTKHFLVPKSLI